MATKPTAFFSADQQAKAAEIKNRILAGENIPLEELTAFLADSRRPLEVVRKKAEAPSNDVDFF